ncbi:MAG: hypothetical protein KF708_02520 [Pirellulales bacterium]|nr:hypothetical protein [Pirellulales bacterium]
MPIAFEELVGSPRIRIADGRFFATREFKIAWSDTIDFAVELLGGYRNIDGTFVFSEPAIFPGVPQAICRDVDLDPFPPDKIVTSASSSLVGNTNLPEFALVTARYTIPLHNNHRQKRKHQPEVPPGTFLTSQSEVGSEQATLPGCAMQWKEDESPFDGDMVLGKLLPTEELTEIWEKVPIELAPWDAIRDARGKVNDAPFLNHAAGTVLFLGAETTLENQLAGDVLVKLTYRFKVREVPSTSSPDLLFGWNHFYRGAAHAGEHWLEIADLDHNAPYPAFDFMKLFTFEP